MKSLNNIVQLDEIFDNPYPVDITHHEHPSYPSTRGEWKTNSGNKYSSIMTHKEGRGESELTFYRHDVPHLKSMSPNGSEPHTAHRVYSTVKSVIKSHMEKNPRINFITFTADKSHPTKIKLYHHLAKSLDSDYRHYDNSSLIRYVVNPSRLKNG